MDIVTKIDKTSDQTLTEEVDAPGKARAVCAACRKLKYYGAGCFYECDRGIACPCLYHKSCYLERLRDEGCEGTRNWYYTLKCIGEAEEHARVLTLIEEERAKRKLHAQNKANAESKLGPREFTLTYAPGKHYLDDDSAKEAMNQAIERLTRYYKDEIIEFHAVGEYTAAGRPHIHGWYHLSGGRKITDKNFRRAYPPWNPKRKLGKGFEGGHHETIERISDFAGYTEKHLDEAWHKTDITRNANDPTLT